MPKGKTRPVPIVMVKTPETRQITELTRWTDEMASKNDVLAHQNEELTRLLQESNTGNARLRAGQGHRFASGSCQESSGSECSSNEEIKNPFANRHRKHHHQEEDIIFGIRLEIPELSGGMYGDEFVV